MRDSFSKNFDFFFIDLVNRFSKKISHNQETMEDVRRLGFVNQRTHHSRSSLSWRKCIYNSLLLGQPHVKSNNRNHEPNVNH